MHSISEAEESQPTVFRYLGVKCFWPGLIKRSDRLSIGETICSVLAARRDTREEVYPSFLVCSALDETLGNGLFCHFNFELHFSLDRSLTESRGPHSGTDSHTHRAHTYATHFSSS